MTDMVNLLLDHGADSSTKDKVKHRENNHKTMYIESLDIFLGIRLYPIKYDE